MSEKKAKKIVEAAKRRCPLCRKGILISDEQLGSCPHCGLMLKSEKGILSIASAASIK